MSDITETPAAAGLGIDPTTGQKSFPGPNVIISQQNYQRPAQDFGRSFDSTRCGIISDLPYYSNRPNSHTTPAPPQLSMGLGTPRMTSISVYLPIFVPPAKAKKKAITITTDTETT
jgi:hypothetical protein